MKRWKKLSGQFFRSNSSQRLLALLPTPLLEELKGKFHLDHRARKLPFIRFVRFMILAILLCGIRISLRRVARKTKRLTVRRLTGLESISHTAISKRLRNMPVEPLVELVEFLQHAVKRAYRQRKLRLPKIHVADASTMEVSPLLVPHAAPNGDKNAVRLTVIMNPETWQLETMIDASETTSDNTTFPEVVKQIKRGQLLIVDAGYTRLADFKRLREKKAHFLAAMAPIYRVQPLRIRKVPRGSARRYQDWVVEADFIAKVGTSRAGGPIKARILVLYNEKTGKHRVLWTSLFSAKVKQLVAAYVMRWRVELLFRWLKTEFDLEHPLSYDVKGLFTYYLLMAVVWALLLLFKTYVQGDRSDRLCVSEVCDDFLAMAENQAWVGYKPPE